MYDSFFFFLLFSCLLFALGVRVDRTNCVCSVVDSLFLSALLQAHTRRRPPPEIDTKHNLHHHHHHHTSSPLSKRTVCAPVLGINIVQREDCHSHRLHPHIEGKHKRRCIVLSHIEQYLFRHSCLFAVQSWGGIPGFSNFVCCNRR